MTTRPTARIEAADAEATIYIYDLIDPYWGIAAADLVPKIDALDVSTIHVRINSPGGDVFDGNAIRNALARHPAKVVTYCDSLAASAASVIMMAGDERLMANGAMVMIHKAWTICVGNDDDMAASMRLLRRIDDDIVVVYEQATGRSDEEIRKWMAAETWFDHDEAIEMNFATGAQSIAAVENSFDLSFYANAPDKVRQATRRDAQDTRDALRAAAFARLAMYERT